MKNKNIIKWFVLPFLLLFLWLILSLFYSSYKSFTVLQYSHSLNEYKYFKHGKLLKNEKIIGEFKAKENNLGIISIRLKSEYIPHGFEEDELIFRIREKGQDNWYYERKYRTGVLRENTLYPFGFPPINSSKNKIYEFELMSLTGNDINARQTLTENPAFISKYKFSEQEIFANSISLINFINKKIITFITNKDLVLSSTFFMLPFVFYMSFIILLKIPFRLLFHKKPLILSVVLLIFFDILLISKIVTGILFGLLGFWIIIAIKSKLSSGSSFFYAFFLLLLAEIFIFFQQWERADKSSTWAYLFLLTGIIQFINEVFWLKIKNIIRLIKRVATKYRFLLFFRYNRRD